MIKKKYLTEVEFSNGVDEFRSYQSNTELFKIKEELLLSPTTLEIVLNTEKLDEETVTVGIVGKYEVPIFWRKVNAKKNNVLEIYTTDNKFVLEDVLEVSYTSLDKTRADLYSVDYENGLLYLANESNVDLICTCKHYNMFVTGDKAEQLETEEYSTKADIASINNKIESYKYVAVYNTKTTLAKEYRTPVIRNIKVNYLNTSEEDSF